MSMTATPLLDALLKASGANIRFRDDEQRARAEDALRQRDTYARRYQDFITRGSCS
jgi:hypothetical protein